MRKILMIALAALVCSGASARTKKKTLELQPKLAPTVQAAPSEQFSYAIGVVQAPSLKQFLAQNEGVQEANYDQFANGLNAKLTEEEENRAIAYAAGIKIARMNRERVIKSLTEQFAGNDSTYFNQDLYVRGLAEAVQGHATMADSTAEAIVEQQSNYRKEVMRCEGLNWLADNAKKPGIKTLPSGLQYEVVTMGNGAIPTDTCQVEVNYEGKLIDGTVFDSSYKRGKPATFGVNQVIKGWTEALCMMPVGSTWNLYIPYDLAYGEQGSRGGIPPYATLVFKVELLSIKDKK